MDTPDVAAIRPDVCPYGHAIAWTAGAFGVCANPRWRPTVWRWDGKALDQADELALLAALDAATRERNALAARVARLEGALRPFVACIDALEQAGWKLADDYPILGDPETRIRLGHLRAARAALADGPP